ncbi:MAG: Fe-S cluster assembly protein SufD [Pseudoxanthomonas sp.]
MSALLDSLADGFQGSPARRAALDEVLRDGLPGPRTEAWKYTSLRALERRVFAKVESVPEVARELLVDIPTPRIVLVNGRYAPGLSAVDDLPAGVSLQLLSELLASGDESARFLARRFERQDEVFARLNGALASEGVLLRVESDSPVAKSVHLVFISAGDGTDRAWHLRNLIELRKGAGLSLVEHHLSAGETAHLSNTLTHVHLAQGARLSHVRVQAESERATSFLRTDAVLGKDTDYQRLDLELGAALSRHELNVRLEGNNARVAANGVLLASGKRHVDTRLGIEHIARDTRCELTWRGLGTGRGRAVFHGGILIREGADGSDAMLSNKNLLLSEGAEIDTQPVLEIHADEVKAAHGATVGQLDANALFYLRSRGLPATQAKQLLTAAFCREPLALLGDATISTALTLQLDHALASAGVA